MVLNYSIMRMLGDVLRYIYLLAFKTSSPSPVVIHLLYFNGTRVLGFILITCSISRLNDIRVFFP